MGKAWISGIEGRAIVTDTSADEAAYYLLEAGGAAPVPCSYLVQHLLRGPDIETIENPGEPPYPIVYEKLDRAWREEQALMLTLMAADPDKPAELRAEAVGHLQELLVDPAMRKAVRNRLLSDPLPETTDAAKLPEGSVVAELLSEACEARPQVQIVRNAWLRVACQFPTEPANLELTCIKRGGFSALVSALKANDPSRFAAWYQSVAKEAMFAQPGAGYLVEAWREEAFDLAQDRSLGTAAAGMTAGLSADDMAPQPEDDDEIGRLYDSIAAFAAEVDAKDPERDQKLADAWARLRKLQAEEADRFYAAFKASLKMPIDAGKRLRAEANALRRKLEDLTSTDPSTEETVRS